FSKDGALLAAGEYGGVVTLWDWRRRERLAEFHGHTGGINSLALSSDGTRLASGDSTGDVKVWDLISRRERTDVKIPSLGSSVVALAFSPDDQVLACAGFLSQTVRLLDGSTGESRKTLPASWGGTNALAFSPDGRSLALAQGDGNATIWSPSTGASLGEIHVASAPLQAIAFSGDGSRIATGSM